MASPDYREQRQFSDTFIPQIKRIVGPHLLSITPDEIDCKQAADLWVFTARDMRIAARVRRFKYLDYKYEFTLRSKLDNGFKTELAKIVDGWGDWMFYAICDKDEKNFECWWLIDLSSFRAGLIRNNMNAKTRLIIHDKPNGDGTHFKAFDLRSFPDDPPILISSSENLPPLTGGSKFTRSDQQPDMFAGAV